METGLQFIIVTLDHSRYVSRRYRVQFKVSSESRVPLI